MEGASEGQKQKGSEEEDGVGPRFGLVAEHNEHSLQRDGRELHVPNVMSSFACVGMELMMGEQQPTHSHFGVEEHLEAELGFELVSNLDESHILLDSDLDRDENWDVNFIRQEQSSATFQSDSEHHSSLMMSESVKEVKSQSWATDEGLFYEAVSEGHVSNVINTFASQDTDRVQSSETEIATEVLMEQDEATAWITSSGKDEDCNLSDVKDDDKVCVEGKGLHKEAEVMHDLEECGLHTNDVATTHSLSLREDKYAHVETLENIRKNELQSTMYRHEESDVNDEDMGCVGGKELHKETEGMDDLQEFRLHSAGIGTTHSSLHQEDKYIHVASLENIKKGESQSNMYSHEESDVNDDDKVCVEGKGLHKETEARDDLQEFGSHSDDIITIHSLSPQEDKSGHVEFLENIRKGESQSTLYRDEESDPSVGIEAASSHVKESGCEISQLPVSYIGRAKSDGKEVIRASPLKTSSEMESKSYHAECLVSGDYAMLSFSTHASVKERTNHEDSECVDISSEVEQEACRESKICHGQLPTDLQHSKESDEQYQVDMPKSMGEIREDDEFSDVNNFLQGNTSEKAIANATLNSPKGDQIKFPKAVVIQEEKVKEANLLSKSVNNPLEIEPVAIKACSGDDNEKFEEKRRIEGEFAPQTVLQDCIAEKESLVTVSETEGVTIVELCSVGSDSAVGKVLMDEQIQFTLVGNDKLEEEEAVNKRPNLCKNGPNRMLPHEREILDVKTSGHEELNSERERESKGVEELEQLEGGETTRDVMDIDTASQELRSDEKGEDILDYDAEVTMHRNAKQGESFKESFQGEISQADNARTEIEDSLEDKLEMSDPPVMTMKEVEIDNAEDILEISEAPAMVSKEVEVDNADEKLGISMRPMMVIKEVEVENTEEKLEASELPAMVMMEVEVDNPEHKLKASEPPAMVMLIAEEDNAEDKLETSEPPLVIIKEIEVFNTEGKSNTSEPPVMVSMEVEVDNTEDRSVVKEIEVFDTEGKLNTSEPPVMVLMEVEVDNTEDRSVVKEVKVDDTEAESKISESPVLVVKEVEVGNTDDSLETSKLPVMAAKEDEVDNTEYRSDISEPPVMVSTDVEVDNTEVKSVISEPPVIVTKEAEIDSTEDKLEAPKSPLLTIKEMEVDNTEDRPETFKPPVIVMKEVEVLDVFEPPVMVSKEFKIENAEVELEIFEPPVIIIKEEVEIDNTEDKLDMLEMELDNTEDRLDISEPSVTVTKEVEVDNTEDKLDMMEMELDDTEDRLDISEPPVTIMKEVEVDNTEVKSEASKQEIKVDNTEDTLEASEPPVIAVKEIEVDNSEAKLGISEPLVMVLKEVEVENTEDKLDISTMEVVLDNTEDKLEVPESFVIAMMEVEVHSTEYRLETSEPPVMVMKEDEEIDTEDKLKTSDSTSVVMPETDVINAEDKFETLQSPVMALKGIEVENTEGKLETSEPPLMVTKEAGETNTEDILEMSESCVMAMKEIEVDNAEGRLEISELSVMTKKEEDENNTEDKLEMSESSVTTLKEIEAEKTEEKLETSEPPVMTKKENEENNTEDKLELPESSVMALKEIEVEKTEKKSETSEPPVMATKEDEENSTEHKLGMPEYSVIAMKKVEVDNTEEGLETLKVAEEDEVDDKLLQSLTLLSNDQHRCDAMEPDVGVSHTLSSSLTTSNEQNDISVIFTGKTIPDSNRDVGCETGSAGQIIPEASSGELLDPCPKEVACEAKPLNEYREGGSEISKADSTVEKLPIKSGRAVFRADELANVERMDANMEAAHCLSAASTTEYLVEKGSGEAKTKTIFASSGNDDVSTPYLENRSYFKEESRIQVYVETLDIMNVVMVSEATHVVSDNRTEADPHNSGDTDNDKKSYGSTDSHTCLPEKCVDCTVSLKLNSSETNYDEDCTEKQSFTNRSDDLGKATSEDVVESMVLDVDSENKADISMQYENQLQKEADTRMMEYNESPQCHNGQIENQETEDVTSVDQKVEMSDTNGLGSKPVDEIKSLTKSADVIPLVCSDELVEASRSSPSQGQHNDAASMVVCEGLEAQLSVSSSLKDQNPSDIESHSPNRMVDVSTDSQTLNTTPASPTTVNSSMQHNNKNEVQEAASVVALQSESRAGCEDGVASDDTKMDYTLLTGASNCDVTDGAEEFVASKASKKESTAVNPAATSIHEKMSDQNKAVQDVAILLDVGDKVALKEDENSSILNQSFQTYADSVSLDCSEWNILKGDDRKGARAYGFDCSEKASDACASDLEPSDEKSSDVNQREDTKIVHRNDSSVSPDVVVAPELHTVSRATEESRTDINVLKGPHDKAGLLFGESVNVDGMESTKMKMEKCSSQHCGSSRIDVVEAEPVIPVTLKSGGKQRSRGKKSTKPDDVPGVVEDDNVFGSRLHEVTLPDLNVTEATLPTLKSPLNHQQEAQLRAQILVYGSLREGSVPEEALMFTAFADTSGASNASSKEGGRVGWEKIWQKTVERLQSRSSVNIKEAKQYPMTGQHNQPSLLQIGTSLSKKNSRATCFAGPPLAQEDARPPVVATTTVQSSDIITARSQASPSWRGQGGSSSVSGRVADITTSSHPPSVISYSWPQPTLGEATHLLQSKSPSVKTTFWTPPLGPFIPPIDSMQWPSVQWPSGAPLIPQPSPSIGYEPSIQPFMKNNTSHDSLLARRTPLPLHRSPALPAAPQVIDLELLPKAPSKQNTESRSRKRRKSQVEPQTARIEHDNNALPHATASPKAASPPPSPTLAMVVVSKPSLDPSIDISPLVACDNTNRMPIATSIHPSLYDSVARANRLEEAKMNADEADALATSVIVQSEAIWSQLQAERAAGLLRSDKDSKLLSAAVAISAAASVAKAAAAAARVAYEAAFQAKLMAEEVESSDLATSEVLPIESSIPRGSPPPSGIENQIVNSCKPIIQNAKKVARERVEAASAATLRAHNIEAVVRAAELAAASISKIGAVVAMGDPIPFTLDILLDAGQDGLTKLGTGHENPSLKLRGRERQTDGKRRHSGVGKERRKPKMKILLQGLEKVGEILDSENVDSQNIVKAGDSSQGLVDNAIQSLAPDEKPELMNREMTQEAAFGGNSDMPKQNSSMDERNGGTEVADPAKNHINKDSIVEVLSNEEGLCGVWFSARVLNIEGGKALVLYDELLSNDGTGKLEEWIDLEAPIDAPPRIRISHPVTRINFEGTRKRRRAAMGNSQWSVGDHVDAWMRDGWWEGQVLEKIDEDGINLKVFFPAGGDTASIKYWNLRPSLVWKDDKWVLWTDIKSKINNNSEADVPAMGETPLGKRQRIKEIPKTNVGNENAESLGGQKSAEEIVMTFHVGKSDTHKDDGLLKTERQEKKGSQVVFGAPKLAKKRKFLEVNKQGTTNMDKGQRERGTQFFLSRATAARNVADDSKLRRNLPKSLQSKVHGEVEDTRGQDKVFTYKNDKFSGFGNSTSSRKETRGQGLASAPKLTKTTLSINGHHSKTLKSETNSARTNKKVDAQLPDNAEKEDGVGRSTSSNKGVLASEDMESLSMDKRVENSSKIVRKRPTPLRLTTEEMEPRRSNRRIQPTPKLLEGLQSTPRLGRGSPSVSQFMKGLLPT